MLSPDADTAITKLQAVSNLVRRKATCDRLCERCFCNAAGRALQHRLRSFAGHVHRQRWGTVAECIRDMLEMKAALRYEWSNDAYLGGSDPQPRAQDPQHSVNVELVDEAVCSEEWWGMLVCLDKLHRVIIISQRWSESCACHWGLPREHVAA